MDLVRSYIICDHCNGNGYQVIRKLGSMLQTQTCFWCKGEGHTGSAYETKKGQRSEEKFSSSDQNEKLDESRGLYS